jgi:phosphate transport system permease protein
LDRLALEEKTWIALMLIATTLVIGSLAAVFAIVLLRGVSALDVAMLTQTPSGGYYFGKGGGILNAIIGSLYLAGGATVLAFVLSLPIALFLREYCNKSKFARFVRLSLDILWGVPSVVLGAFIFIVMLSLASRASLFWGIITGTLLILPIMTRAIDEVVSVTPLRMREASYAVGSTRLETALKVITRQALPGIVTATLLSFGRVIGDAASMLFTAGYTDSIPRSIFDPVATLPLAIFFQLATPIPEVQRRAYASAIILLIMVTIASIASRVGTSRHMKYVIK